MKRFLLSIFCLIFINNLSANEGLTGFCFEEAVSLATIKGYLQPILLAKDKIYPRDSVNCVEINLSAILWISQKLGSSMEPGSAIVNISSTDAFVGSFSTIAYSATKAALNNLTMSLGNTLG